MPLLFRKIKKSRWYREKKPEWLQSHDVPADAVTDLKTDENKLSVYQCRDNSPDIDLVIAALAASGDHPANVDYAVIGQTMVDQAQISIQEIPGSTPDASANKLHRDLVELSGNKILRLAEIIFDGQTEIKRVSEKAVIQLISDAVASGRIARENLKEGIRSKIREPGK